MAPNLRPTLSTRIRASFDGKGAKSKAQKPQESNTFVVQDTATLRDAIGQAISNDSFQSAIAAHLARLIEPSIKDALDTIQPVVETVYQHDILLRKTNRSVEDLLQRFDSAAEKEDHENATKVSKNVVGAEDIKQLLSEHSAQNSAKIEELAGTLREGHATTAQAVTDIAEIKAALSLSSKSLTSLTSAAQQSSTDNFKLQEQLDELKVDISNILKSMETQGSTLFQIKEADLATVQILGDVQQSHASHALALNEIKAHDQSFKSASIPIFEKTHADTATAFQALTANLAALKENVKASFASENDTISALGARFDRVLTSIDTINGNDSGHEILSAVRKSNDFHTIHVTALEGIMDRLATPSSSKDVPAETDSFASVKEHLSTIATTLDSHTNHLSTIRDSDKSADILAAVSANNESQVARGADLEEIKAATKAIQEVHTSNTTDLAEIKAAVTVAGESHTSHAKNFEDLQAAMIAANESHASHAMALETIKATGDNNTQGVASQARSLDALGTQMGTVIATLGSQSIVQSDIRDTVHVSQEAHMSHSADLGEIKEISKAAGESHTAHATALDGMKSMQEGTNEQLAAHAAYLNGVQEQVGTVANNIREQTAMHFEIRDAVHASNNSHATHTKNLEEVIAAHNSSNTQLAKQTTTLDTVKSQLGDISDTLDHQSAIHSQLLDAVQTSNTSHISHAAALDKAETAHEDILGGVNVSRELLVGHKDVLTSHASLLENVRDAHLKNHDDVMDAVKESRGLLESQAETLRGMEDKHEEISNSVQALSRGVHLNENGLGQLRDHVKEPFVAETSKSIPAMTEESNPSDSLLSQKSIVGLGMATVAGGGLLAVASSEGLFAHGSEGTNEQKPLSEESVLEPTKGVKDDMEVKPEDSVRDVVDPAEEVKQVDSGAKVTEHVEAENPAERLEDVSGPTKGEKQAEPEEETFDSTRVEVPAESAEEIVNSGVIEESANTAEETFDSILAENPVVSKEAKTDPAEVVKSAEPAEVNAQVGETESIEPIKEDPNPVEVVKPIELAQQEGESKQLEDVVIKDHEAEPINGDQLVGEGEPVFDESNHELTNEPAVEEPVAEGPSSTESIVQAGIHETARQDVLENKDPLRGGLELRTGEATEEIAELDQAAPIEEVEPTVEAVHQSEMLHKNEPTAEHPALEQEVSPDANLTTEEHTTDGLDLGESSSLPQSSVEQPLHDANKILEEPVHDSTRNQTLEVSTTDKPIQDEPGKESKSEHQDSLKESPVEDEPSQQEIPPGESELSHEIEPEHSVKSAFNGNLLAEATADVPAHDSENLAANSSITKKQSLDTSSRTHVLEPADKIEYLGDDPAPVRESATIVSATEQNIIEPDSVEKARTIASEPATMTDATSGNSTPKIESSQEVKAPEIEQTVEKQSVEHEPAVENISAEQSIIETTPTGANDLRPEIPGFETLGGENSDSTLENESGIGDPTTQETNTDPAVVEKPALEEGKEATKPPLAVASQVPEENDLNFGLLAISESIPETRNVPQDSIVAESVTEHSENTHLPDINTEEVKKKTSDAVGSVATEAVQEYDGTSKELEKVHEAEPSFEAKPITGKHSIVVEDERHSESVVDVKKDASGLEALQEEPVVEGTAGEDQTADTLAPKPLATSDLDANLNNVTTGLTDEAALVEPVIIESAMRTRNGGTERRPSLMKRVSFKEQPEVVKSAHENDAEAEPLSARDTIMEEQDSEAGQTIDESTTKEPLVEIQHKSTAAAADTTVVETPHVHDTLMESKSGEEELTVESASIVAGESLAKEKSAELKHPNDETFHSISESLLPESGQTSQVEPSTETELDVKDPLLVKSDHMDSLIPSFAEDNNDVIQAEAKPMLQQDLNQLQTSLVEPIKEHQEFANNEEAEKMSTGDNIGNPEPVTENSMTELEEGKNSETKVREENELSSDHDTISSSTSQDRDVEHSDKSDSTQHVLISHKHTEAPQNVVLAAAEESITEPHVASNELPPPVNSPVTGELNEKLSENLTTDEPAVSSPSVHEHALDQPAAEVSKNYSVADNSTIEEPTLENSGAVVKDLTEEGSAGKVIADKSYATELATGVTDEPVQETSIVHIPSLNGTEIEEPSEIEAMHEEPTTTKLIGIADEAATESTINVPATVSDSTQATPTAEEPALHEKNVGDIAENPVAVITAVDEPAVHESTKGTVVESKASEEPVEEPTLTEKPPSGLNASSEVPNIENTPAEESFETKSLQENHPTVADTPTNAYPTEKNVDQSGELSIGKQDESTTEGSVLNAHGSEKEDVTEERSLTEAVALEGKTNRGEATTNEPANEIESSAEEVDPKTEQVAISTAGDIKLAAIDESTSVKPDISIEQSGEIGTRVEDANKESEHAEGVVHTTEPEASSEKELSEEIAQAPEIETTEKEATKEEKITHNPANSEAPAIVPSGPDSVLHESASNEPTDGINFEDPISTTPPNVQPIRVDSGIDVETPTDVKPASNFEPLDTLTEDRASGDNVNENLSSDIATKEPVAENFTTKKSVLENKPQKNEQIAVESTTEEPNIKAEPVVGEARKEMQDNVADPVEEDQSFDAMNTLSSKTASTATIEPSAKTESVANEANGNPLEENTLAEPAPATQGEKELQINTKNNVKEQHARVDSGIDVETLVKEPFGKLQSVVEVKPALGIEQRLEGE